MNTKRFSVDAASYAPLMSLIGHAESNDNYNAYFGNPSNNDIQFTSMSIDQVLKWQSDFIAKGNPSSAIGKYQIINTTLSGLVKELSVDGHQKFDQDLQDRMVIALFERRGSIAYVNNELSKENFATNLSKEWAALPKVTGQNPTHSYYAGDGLNVSRVAPESVLTAIDLITAK